VLRAGRRTKKNAEGKREVSSHRAGQRWRRSRLFRQGEVCLGHSVGRREKGKKNTKRKKKNVPITQGGRVQDGGDQLIFSERRLPIVGNRGRA